MLRTIVLLTVLNVCTWLTSVFEIIFLPALKCAFFFQHGWTPLHWAASYGHKALAELLLDRGACVAAADKVGHCTALFRAGSLPVE